MAEITVYYIILIYFLMDKSSPLLAETSFNFTSTLFPSKNYEMLRFATHRSIFERWRALKYQLLTEEDEIHRHKFKILHEKFREHYIEIMAHMNLLRQNDDLNSVRIQANELLR